MKNKILFILFYSFSIITFILYLYIDYVLIIVNPLVKLFILFIICILTYFGGHFLIKYNKKYKYISYKLNLIIWFILYVIFLLRITLFDSFFNRRNILFIGSNRIIFRDYMNYVINLIPFRVIISFIIDFINKAVSFDKFIYNLLGNFIAFTPFAFFLPRLFKKMSNTKTFIITMFVIVSIIEIIQFITLTGTFDIDDYILNISGAYVMFKLLKKDKVKKYLNIYINYDNINNAC